MMKLALATALALLYLLPAHAPSARAAGNCSDYVDLSGTALPLTVAGTTGGATNDYGPFPSRPECWQGERWTPSSAQGPDVTYRWAAPAAGEYILSLCQSEETDTDLLLYDFTCPAEPVYPEDFICGSDGGCGTDGLLGPLPFRAGEEVLIVVDGGTEPAGPFELNIYETHDLETTIEVLMDAHHIPGTSACIVGTDGVLWKGNFGLASIAENRAVTDSTIFYVASVSKPVTGAALMQLYDDGGFALDDDINDYLPFPVVHPLFPDSTMTFRMLLSHVAGIDDNWDVLRSVEVCDMNSPIPLGQFLEDYLTPGGLYYDPELNFTVHPPGTDYEYTNVGASLAGYLVETIASTQHPGTTLESHCQEHLFGPLGMNDTSWFLSGVNAANLAVPYYYWGNGFYVAYCQLGIPWYPSTMLRTSALQLARFLGAILRGGEIDGVRILESRTVDEILTVHYPALYDYGLFWSYESWLDQPTWGHGGVYWGTRTFMWFFPDHEVGGVVLTNSESTDGMWDISRRVMEYGFRLTTGLDERAPPSPSSAHLRFQSSLPNPFRGTTDIRYELSAPATPVLEVFDVSGRLVRLITQGSPEPPGIHSIRWDGRDERGRSVAPGTYFVRLSTGRASVTGRVTLAR